MTLHGGNLFVHSEGIGCGSTFTMEMPLCSERNSNNPCVDIDDVECTSFRIKSVSPMRRDKLVSPFSFSNKEIEDMDVVNSPYITNTIDIIEANMRSQQTLVSTHSTHDNDNDNENENEKQMETDDQEKAKPIIVTSTSINAVCEH
eukprot:gene25414-46435_t